MDKTAEKNKSLNSILVVGSGNIENVIKLDGELCLDGKHVVDYLHSIGGSGVNVSLRLMNNGFSAMPILTVGDDNFGKNIRDILLETALSASLPDHIMSFLKSNFFFSKTIKTPISTVLVENERRTIFSEKINKPNNFMEHIHNCIQYFSSQNINMTAALIGHIQSDSIELNPINPGECTKILINKFSEKASVFANFGYSQLCLGYDFWKPHLKKVSIFQLNLAELNQFIFPNKITKAIDKIKYLKSEKITAIITLDKYGVIGIYGDDKEDLILAKVNKITGFTDSTGAGDAFLGGIASKLHKKKNFHFLIFTTQSQKP